MAAPGVFIDLTLDDSPPPQTPLQATNPQEAEAEGPADVAVGNLEEDLTCSICHNVFTQPVCFLCGHVFCAGCSSALDSCALCRRPTTKTAPMFVLRAIIEKHKEAVRRANHAATSGAASSNPSGSGA